MRTILITVDALRADHLGQYGYTRNTMPTLDRLVEAGTTFERAYSNAPYTRISIPSFQTSRYLAYMDIERHPTIASVLNDRGVQTAVIGTQTGINLIDGDFGYTENIDLGRDRFQAEAAKRQSPRDRLISAVNSGASRVSQGMQQFETAYRLGQRAFRMLVPRNVRILGYTSAARVTDRAIAWVEHHRNEEFFLWLHYMEGHRPYGVHNTDPEYLDTAPDEGKIMDLMKRAGTRPEEISSSERQLMIDAYDSDLRYCSAHIERLFDELVDRGIWTDTNVVFSSDHGEEFYEHGQYFHRNDPYDELIHVPLLVKGCERHGRNRIADQRELLDLAPTICEFHDVEADDVAFLGQSLFDGDGRKVISIGSGRTSDEIVVAGRWDGWKYINHGGSEKLYDVDEDPDETRSVLEEHPDVGERFRETIPDYLFDRDPETLRDPSDQVDREQLDALGYLELENE